MLTFTPDGSRVLVANEGEPNNTYTIDPEGSVSIIDVSRGAANVTQSDVRAASFAVFNSAARDSSIRIFGPGASVAQDLEPEYIAVSPDGDSVFAAGIDERIAMFRRITPAEGDPLLCSVKSCSAAGISRCSTAVQRLVVCCYHWSYLACIALKS